MTFAKENYLNALNHKPTEFVPAVALDCVGAGASIPVERGTPDNPIDGFGVRWVSPPTAAGGALPAPGEFMLTDVTEWKQKIKFPDLSIYDWEKAAEKDLAPIDRDAVAVEISNSNCIYERLATFMGFEGALIAMAIEPEATYELLEKLTDFKIETVKYFAKYYKPDIFTFFDDVATERSLFMAPETYRKLLKPLHKKLVQAIKDCGIIPIQHTCGKADSIVEDMIDIGAHGWSAVQATNDIEEIIEKHGDRFTIVGGYDSNGAPGLPGATEEQIREEVLRCMTTYGKYGRGYIFSGNVLQAGTIAITPQQRLDAAAPVRNAVIDWREGRLK